MFSGAYPRLPAYGLASLFGARTYSLAFGTAPADGFVGVTLDTFTVAGAVPGSTVTVTPATGAATSGNTATANASGVATFSALVLDTYAAAQTLTASSPGATDAVSDAFLVYSFAALAAPAEYDFRLPAGTQTIPNLGSLGAAADLQNGSTAGVDTEDVVFNDDYGDGDGGDRAAVQNGTGLPSGADPWTMIIFPDLTGSASLEYLFGFGKGSAGNNESAYFARTSGAKWAIASWGTIFSSAISVTGAEQMVSARYSGTAINIAIDRLATEETSPGTITLAIGATAQWVSAWAIRGTSAWSSGYRGRLKYALIVPGALSDAQIQQAWDYAAAIGLVA